MKTYWPYLPMLLVVGLGLMAGNYISHSSKSVLGYATNLSPAELLIDTNHNRQKFDETNLSLNSQLMNAAQAKAGSMAKLNYWSHNTPSGQPPWLFIKKAGYNYASAGENLAYGFGSSQATLAAWMQSPKHRANILDGQYRDVGFGIANAPNYQGHGSETIIVAEYGQPASAVVAASAPGNQANSGNFQAATAKPAAAQHLSRLQTSFGANAPLVIALTLLVVLATVVFFTKHWLHWRRALVKSQEFVIHHPWLDVMLVAVIMAGVVLSQGVGFIS